MNAELLRILLGLYLIAAFALTVAYLRRRRMRPTAYALWGVFALLVPVFGPFFVVAFQPGRPVTLAGAAPARRRRRGPLSGT